MDQILGPPKARATTIYLTVGPFGLSRKVTTTILPDAPDRLFTALSARASASHQAQIDLF